MMRLRTWSVLFLAFCLVGTPAAAEMASPLEVAKRLGLSDASIEKVKQGEVVVQEIEAASEKDLSLALVAVLEAPLAKVEEFIKTERMADLSTVTISHGEIDPSTFSLTEMELPDDILARLAKDPAGTLFMSTDEAARVKEGAKQGKAQALTAYQAVLSARAKAYWEGGMAAIKPYGGDDRSPRIDLGHANEAVRKLVTVPAVLAALDVVPAKDAGPIVHRLTWAVQKGRDQAAPVLSHRFLYVEDDGEILVERRFYSGYDYDALQIAVGVLPTPDNRSVVFYTTHTFTAQVAGFGGGAKRSIGRKLMSRELVAEIERAQKDLSGSQ